VAKSRIQFDGAKEKGELETKFSEKVKTRSFEIRGGVDSRGTRRHKKVNDVGRATMMQGSKKQRQHSTVRDCIRAGHIPSSHRKSIINFIPQLIDFGITINLTLEFIPTS
jgi:hypothetical protein